jgi:hypothetical protein
VTPVTGTAATNGPVADLTVGKAPPPEVRPPDPGRPPEIVDEDVPQVDETVVRTMLRAVGGGLGYSLGDEDVPEHWRFTERELDDLTPPLTRIVNRNAKLRRAVIRGDEMAVMVAVGGYMGRNMSDGMRAGRARRERDGEAALAEADARTNGPGQAPGSIGGTGAAGGWGGGHGRADDRGVG